MPLPLIAVFFLIVGPAALAGTLAPPAGLPQLILEPIAEGVGNPIAVAPAPGVQDARYFVADQRGFIHVVKEGVVLPAAALDISTRLVLGNELGLLGLALHPDFAVNQYLYLYWTERVDGVIYTVISRYTMSLENADVVDPASERVLLTYDQKTVSHQAGCLQFGPHDGYLYIASGDGGWRQQAVNTSSFLGNILRIDVDGGEPYGIPADNPFVGVPGFRPEIFAFGLRNPWRFGFDRLTGDLYFGDVGQNTFEEINVLPASSGGGQHFGWPTAEGYKCFDPGDNLFGECGFDEGLTPPLAALSQQDRWRAIIGGPVYRGEAMPRLRGYALFGEYSAQRIAAVRWTPGAELPLPVYDLTELLDRTGTPFSGLSSFGEDKDGEFLVCSRLNGRVYRLAPKYHRSDLNEDGEINAVDVQLVINAALGAEADGVFPDVNGDESVNAVDVQLVINFALGL